MIIHPVGERSYRGETEEVLVKDIVQVEDWGIVCIGQNYKPYSSQMYYPPVMDEWRFNWNSIHYIEVSKEEWDKLDKRILEHTAVIFHAPVLKGVEGYEVAI